MLSRVAERIYWQARYLERVENTARLLNVFSSLLLDLPGRTKLGWRALVRITGTTELFATRYNILPRNPTWHSVPDFRRLRRIDPQQCCRWRGRMRARRGSHARGSLRAV